MDLAVGAYVSVSTVGMLNVPVKILLPTTRRLVRNPFIAGLVEIAALGTAVRIFQPVTSEGRHVRVPSATRQ
jgi:hypothetical protein